MAEYDQKNIFEILFKELTFNNLLHGYLRMFTISNVVAEDKCQKICFVSRLHI